VVEEADETVFWLELLVESKIMDIRLLPPLIEEATEILKIISKARKTTRS